MTTSIYSYTYLIREVSGWSHMQMWWPQLYKYCNEAILPSSGKSWRKNHTPTYFIFIKNKWQKTFPLTEYFFLVQAALWESQSCFWCSLQQYQIKRHQLQRDSELLQQTWHFPRSAIFHFWKNKFCKYVNSKSFLFLLHTKILINRAKLETKIFFFVKESGESKMEESHV